MYSRGFSSGEDSLGIGEGSAMLRPWPIAIISWLIVQSPLLLIVFSAILSFAGRPRG
jgi:hypothetical protein